jgi:hypothetical protein
VFFLSLWTVPFPHVENWLWITGILNRLSDLQAYAPTDVETAESIPIDPHIQANTGKICFRRELYYPM